MARKTNTRTISGIAEAWYRARWDERAEHGASGGSVLLCRLRTGAVRINYKVRKRDRMAEFLGAARRCGWHNHRSRVRDAADRGPLCTVQRAPRSCVRRRTPAYRPAVLHERRIAGFSAKKDLKTCFFLEPVRLVRSLNDCEEEFSDTTRIRRVRPMWHAVR